jgi:hypothetical protein
MLKPELPPNLRQAPQRVIKKYPNRRLYDTTTSSYVTLSEIKQLVMQGHSFVVRDAKSGEDLTRSLLLQIILEEESVWCAYVYRGGFGQYHSLLWAFHAGPHGGLFREQFAIAHAHAVENGASVAKHHELKCKNKCRSKLPSSSMLLASNPKFGTIHRSHGFKVLIRLIKILLNNWDNRAMNEIASPSTQAHPDFRPPPPKLAS